MRVFPVVPSPLQIGIFGVLAMLVLASASVRAEPALPGVKLDVSEADVRRAKPGAVLRVRPQIGGAPANAKAFRVIYRSTGINGEPIAVSGTIIYPDGPAPPEGRNVVAWAHYTTGVAQRCAPTLLPNLSGTIAGLEELLKRGYVVVATDYEGLGLPGVHAYLVGVSEAHSVLDCSARRAQPQQRPRHQPLYRVGTFAGRPRRLVQRRAGGCEVRSGTEARRHRRRRAGHQPRRAVQRPEGLDCRQQPHRHGAAVVVADLQAARSTACWRMAPTTSFEKVADSCIQSISQMLKLLQLAKPLKKSFLKADPTTLPAWRELMEKNSPGKTPRRRAGVHRARDRRRHRRPRHHRRALPSSCAPPARPLPSSCMKGVSHSFAAEKSAYAAVAWMSRPLQEPSGTERLQTELIAPCAGLDRVLVVAAIDHTHRPTMLRFALSLRFILLIEGAIAQVMGGTDVFLFGIVLVIFAYNIDFGFVFELGEGEKERLPGWMRPAGMHQLKTTLVGVILVYLVVDFATDWAEGAAVESWVALVKPISILLIAGALRLLAMPEPGDANAH